MSNEDMLKVGAKQQLDWADRWYRQNPYFGGNAVRNTSSLVFQMFLIVQPLVCSRTVRKLFFALPRSSVCMRSMASTSRQSLRTFIGTARVATDPLLTLTERIQSGTA